MWMIFTDTISRFIKDLSGIIVLTTTLGPSPITGIGADYTMSLLYFGVSALLSGLKSCWMTCRLRRPRNGLQLMTTEKVPRVSLCQWKGLTDSSVLVPDKVGWDGLLAQYLYILQAPLALDPPSITPGLPLFWRVMSQEFPAFLRNLLGFPMCWRR